jgi:hypothetical protein
MSGKIKKNKRKLEKLMGFFIGLEIFCITAIPYILQMT